MAATAPGRAREPASPPRPRRCTARGAGRRALAAKGRYELVTTQAQLDAWLEKLRDAELIAFDTETTSLDAMQAEIVGPRSRWRPATRATSRWRTTTPAPRRSCRATPCSPR